MPILGLTRFVVVCVYQYGNTPDTLATSSRIQKWIKVSYASVMIDDHYLTFMFNIVLLLLLLLLATCEAVGTRQDAVPTGEQEVPPEEANNPALPRAPLRRPANGVPNSVEFGTADGTNVFQQLHKLPTAAAALFIKF
eukprot:1177699-Prorocentrum_minimum.AAC.4